MAIEKTKALYMRGRSYEEMVADLTNIYSGQQSYIPVRHLRVGRDVIASCVADHFGRQRQWKRSLKPFSAGQLVRRSNHRSSSDREIPLGLLEHANADYYRTLHSSGSKPAGLALHLPQIGDYELNETCRVLALKWEEPPIASWRDPENMKLVLLTPLLPAAP
jgi:hypothetical protein